MTDRFAICWPYTLAQECPHPNDWSNPANFSNDPHDPGGATMDGVIQTEYNKFRLANNLPIRSVQLITMPEGSVIYRNNYWLPKCPSLVPGVDLDFFDTAVNLGPTGATYVLQSALGVAVDGVWGPITNAAVVAIADVPSFIRKFAAARLAAYQGMSGWPYFGRGWSNRNSEIEADSLSMVTTPAGIRVARAYNKSHSARPSNPKLRAPIKIAA